MAQGLLGGVLPAIYSGADQLKRGVYGLLTNPQEQFARASQSLLQSHNERQALMKQAFADPTNPTKVTDPQALAKLGNDVLMGELGIAPVGMTKIINPKMTLDEFAKLSEKGQIRQARSTDQDLADILAKKMPATKFDIGMSSKYGFDYEMGDFTKKLKDAGLTVYDDKMGTVIAGQSKEAVDLLKNAKTPIEYGQSFGYQPEDILKFYVQRRGGNPQLGYADFMDDLNLINKSEGLLGNTNLTSIYHGTDPKAAKAIEKSGFDINKSADGTIWFTSNPEIGEVAATGKGAVVQRYLDENKVKLGGWDEIDKFSVDELIQKGYDGVKLQDETGTVFQIFNPEKLTK